MKKIRVQDAVGETLCHDMTTIQAGGFSGVCFKRGHVIIAEDTLHCWILVKVMCL
jgi:hypothetical protein